MNIANKLENSYRRIAVHRRFSFKSLHVLSCKSLVYKRPMTSVQLDTENGLRCTRLSFDVIENAFRLRNEFKRTIKVTNTQNKPINCAKEKNSDYFTFISHEQLSAVISQFERFKLNQFHDAHLVMTDNINYMQKWFRAPKHLSHKYCFNFCINTRKLQIERVA